MNLSRIREEFFPELEDPLYGGSAEASDRYPSGWSPEDHEAHVDLLERTRWAGSDFYTGRKGAYLTS